MSLSELIDGVVASEKTLTVFDPSDGVVEQLAEHFVDRNVSVESASSDEGPSNFAVLRTDETFHTAVSVDEILKRPEDIEPGFERDSYAPILDHLDEMLFTSYDREQMLSATREIEDRAWRVGAGEIHAGFQVGRNISPQLETYRRLGSRDELSVHAYVYPDSDIPRVDQFQLHLSRSDEIRNSWFVVYDGNGVDDYKCALVAEETDSDVGFSGFWTYDPATVDYITNYLVTSYFSIESDGAGEFERTSMTARPKRHRH